MSWQGGFTGEVIFGLDDKWVTLESRREEGSEGRSMEEAKAWAEVHG